MTQAKIVNPGRTTPLFNGVTSGGTPLLVDFVCESDSLQLSLFVRAVTGSVTVTCDTLTTPGERTQILAFTPVTLASTELVLQQALVTPMSNCQLRIAFTGVATLQVVAKGLTTADSSSSTVSSVTVHDGDGDELDINTDGSINVVVTSATTGTTPAIRQVVLTTAGVEQAITLTSGTQWFKFHNVGNHRTLLSYVLGGTGAALFLTIPPAVMYTEEESTMSVIYARPQVSGQIIELVEYT